MKILTCLLLCAALLLCCLPAMGDVSSRAPEDYTPALKDLAAAHGFRIGLCLSPNQLSQKDYLSFLAAQFNTTTCTNETKAYSLLDQAASRAAEDGMPRMNYTVADKMIAWAQENGVGVRGHVLTWDAYMTDWFFHEDYDSARPIAQRDVLLARMESYITQVVTHFEETFPGVIYCWDVVNEAMGDSPQEYRADDPRHIRTMRNGAPNPFYDYVGEDYVEYSFLFARNAVEALGADIKLYYNDYNAYFSDKATAIRKLAASVNSYVKNSDGSDRKLLDGIGMQGYWSVDYPNISAITGTITIFSKLDLEIQITELSVGVDEETPEAFEEQAKRYRNIFLNLKALDTQGGGTCNITNVTFFGLKDHYVAGDKTNARLFDKDLNPKPAFDAVLQILKMLYQN